MLNERFRLKSNAALLVAIAAAYPCAGECAPAARIDFAVGNVTAVTPDGRERPLAKGAQVDQGETVNTNNGRAQMRFTDGAYVSLQPQSQFRIDQYKFDGKTDGSEKGFFSLLKGGLRTITGLVGRTNKQNYQVNTSVATIGIRGTEYTIQYGASISGTVGEGEIQVCNGAGCLNVTSGESYYVQGENVKPELSNKKTDLPAPPPSNPPTYFATGENRNADGSPSILGGPPGLVGAVAGAHVAFSSPNNQDALGPVQAILGSNGAMSSFTIDSTTISAAGNTPTPGTVTLGATINSAGNDGIVAWGIALGGAQGTRSICCLSTSEPFHYVVGIVTPDADMQQIGSMMGTYSLIGATTPTVGATVVGSVTAGTLIAYFGTSNATLDLSMKINNAAGAPVAVSASGSASVNPNSNNLALFYGSLSAFAPSCTSGCGSGSGSFSGFFAGTNASRAGLAYQLNDLQLSPGVSVGNINGAAVFKQTSLTLQPL